MLIALAPQKLGRETPQKNIGLRARFLITCWGHLALAMSPTNMFYYIAAIGDQNMCTIIIIS